MSQAPAWIRSLVDTVSGCMQAHTAMGPLGFRWGEQEEYVDLLVYPTPIELVGGADDGAVVFPGFSLDVHELCSTFDAISDVTWCAHPLRPHDPDGPHIAIDGVYQEHPVYLRILSDAPADEDPGLKVDCSRGEH